MKLIRQFCILFLVLISTGVLSGQKTLKSIKAKYITTEIDLDGKLDEAIWDQAETTDEFWQFFPTDSLQARYPTDVKILFDDNAIYVGITAWAPNGNYVVSSLRRDFGGTTNDNVSLLFDTFNDGINAFFFGVTPYGVQREGLVSGGGTNFNNTWDIKWQAESTRYDDHYVVEISIPFTSLKFIENGEKWRFRSYRWNLQTNEQSSWVRVPQNQLLSSLAYMGELEFEKPLGESKTPVFLIPYVNTLAQKDYVLDQSDYKLKFGGDAKVAVGNGMNLDLTLNPDFSNVEVDDIFTNLTRFELRLPEKRQFFIDNNDLFDNFGNYFNEARPFFSRRIGLARDKNGNLIENQIIGGARLSGKLNPNWRLGFLNIQTDSDFENEIGSYNNMMLAMQRKVFSRSNVGFFMINKETFGNYEFLDESEKFNRVIGMDYNLASSDDVWNGRAYLHKSFQPGDSDGNLSSQATILYNTRNWEFILDWVYINEDFRSDLGFVPRTDIVKSGASLTRNFYPNSDVFNRHGFGFLNINYWRPSLDMKKTDHLYNFTYNIDFKDQSTLEMTFSNNYIFLTRSFDPTRSPNGTPLPGNEGYTFNQFSTSYLSNRGKLFTYGFESTLGQFFNGNSYSVATEMGIRFQPWAQVSMAINYDGIRLPDPYPDADLWLVSPKFDITFSKSLFWSTLLQYSNQRNNFGINSRLQWRFAPLSDLHLVYNDSYRTDIFSSRFRSINLKMTYWLNI